MLLNAIPACSSTVSGGDYVAATRTITFPAGEISVPILVGTSDDSVAELTEMFEAVLRNPSEGVVLGGQSQAAVTILDNDGNLFPYMQARLLLEHSYVPLQILWSSLIELLTLWPKVKG